MNPNKSEINASIDIGTNSVLLLVAEKNGRQLIPVKELQEVPRLGKGVDSGKTLHPDSCNRVLSVLKSYRNFLEQSYPETLGKVIVTATSAVRDASNRDAFIKMVHDATGWKVRLLSGDEEARTTFYGAVSVLDQKELPRVVLDIGGGSTEIAYGVNGVLRHAVSLDMGSVRFSERFLKSNPPGQAEIEAARKETEELLKPLAKFGKEIELVGVAGTVTSIAAIELNLSEYDPGRLTNYPLKREFIERFTQKISALKASEIERDYAPFLKGRGDVIIGGLIILGEFIKWCGKDEITVSTGGIRHGILLHEN